ncbi:MULTISPECIES: biosynthetic-type acetolactate synthase large subunit [unclassified Clostridium]|jgi:acetolactate synthase-1/2/3 large subunit|uniref:biosynthetic-type acetolactate synthase large subunit n=1 Tax=Clostridium TaxID=1485 RepID=UPI001C8BEDF3|nr:MULTISPECIES: biosynthetic-type acetolactate synthase large subunit [unclassified Clostridium]MBX9137083.1 biosynthetic-type acetolactate synthase large subunit [Clostridium sp. K12(2020)]MBX9143828.1 biosynthetic-type acetolactate synthase large subunit [Clostridium sp. K13]MDU2288633.1 biosynthetic-type acetolactate synthase large subunit [Clostridium celatum]MDU4325220.1 biosynthetic-type acetolactate synthase large subunit [Clostridium celatum]
MLLTGAEILVKSLLDEGVDTIFGYPGGSVLNIYDYLYKYKDKIKHYLSCHEQSAAHAADGYARSTGRVGVCIATSGPGATNLVTGIATAYMDSVPLIAITGNVPKDLLGKDSFQEVDITGITMPITKHNFIVKDINNLQETIRKAFFIAREGRPGPVLIDIPKDITVNKTEYKDLKPLEVNPKTKHITESALNEVAKYINESSKPLIYAGGGVINSDSTEELINFAEKLNAPVATTLMCRGAIPSEHRLNTGMIGMHGSNASNILATKCDLIIALGARFSDRVISDREFINNAKVIQIDVDPAEVNKNVKVDSFIIGDIKVALQKLIPLLNEKKNKEWLNTVEELKLLAVTKNNSDDGEELTPRFLFEKLSDMDKGDFIITTEVGQHQMWTAQYFNFKTPRTLISSGGLGTMGFGLGASIGVKVANPDKTVFNIAGDGSFGMNCNEFATAVKYNIPIKVIVMNNNALGMVRQWQSLFYEARYSQTTLDRATDFVKLAEAFGGVGFRVEKREELDDVLKEALAVNKPVIIDYRIDSDKKVFPMVAPGAPIHQIINEEDLKC